MSAPLVSILIPAFNHERFVVRCLDSVLEDPWPAKELVVVDDGSTDGTAERIAAWVEAHRGALPIRFVRRGNRGVAATLNELATLARGEFLRLGASDDYLLPGGLAAQIAYLHMHPRKDAVVGDSIVVDTDDRRLHGSGMRGLHRANKRLYRSDEGIRRAVIGQWAVGGAVAMLRRRALERVGGWTEGLRIDDWDFFLRLAARDALGFIDVRVCAYRVHAGNVSRTRQVPTRLLHLAESRGVAQRHLALFEGADRTLLRAQVHYIGAKIAFLRRRPGAVAAHMAAYLALAAMARVGLPRPPPLVEHAS
ncbi:glycosyltransferase family 2 protein [Fulvimonas yonginensis]|uniref:Glycosyltransferase n=1 Tax=Fulvimonas yonginensis TaxID=1495200 RepID=A0ABU8JBI8_9GAMM